MKLSSFSLLLISIFLLSCGTESTTTYSLTVSVNPSESGSITVEPNKNVYDEGETVEITFTPNQGWNFVEWTGDLNSSNNPTSIKIDSDKSISVITNKLFYLNDNGVTIMCPETSPGDIGLVDGVEYESVDRELLLIRRDEGKDLSKICVSLVITMRDLFYRNSNIDGDINNWDVSNVTNMSNMFDNSQFNKDISDWDVSNVNDMGDMFSQTPFNQDISNWDVSNVTDMRYMFLQTPFNYDIRGWDVSSVVDMRGMFISSSFNQDISDWDVSNVTNMSGLFFNSPFNQDISNWDVSNVTDMSGIFQETPFNQPIGNWDVSSVTDMSEMFSDSQFNQDISMWCVANIASEPSGFSTNSPLTEQNKPVWGTCPSN